MDLLFAGFANIFSPYLLFYCFFGVLLGTLIGVLPGIGSLPAVALLLPATFHLEPAAALIMLSGIYYGAEYGGSTASILLNLPGSPSNAVTCLDGYPLAQQGKAGPALFITTIVSFFGGSVGIILMTFLTPVMGAMALALGPAEYFSLLVLALVVSASIGSSPLKGVAMILIGVLLGTVGIDVNSGVYRFTLGAPDLFDGISLIAVALGTFGVAEIITSVDAQRERRSGFRVRLRDLIPSMDDMKRTWKPMLRGTAVGSVLGPLPGAGPTITSLIAYSVEKRVSKEPERFGKGAIEGIASPEASNNASIQTAFVPTLSLGIPGNATMAIMLGALMIHGISPGPQFMRDNSELFWTLIASFWVGNLFLLVLNIPLVGVWVKLLQIPYRILFPVVIALVCAGIYSLSLSTFEIWMVASFGLLGYVMRTLNFEAAPLLIGFILGPMVEERFRRAFLLSGGDVFEVLQRPLTGLFLACAIAALVWMIWTHFRRSNVH